MQICTSVQAQHPRLKEVIQLMRKEKWTFSAETELKYKIPDGSIAVAEGGGCVQYGKPALA